MPTTVNTEVYGDTLKSMSESFADTMRTTMKFNEDTTRFWSDTVTRNSDEFRTRTQRFVDEVAPFSKQNAERFQKSFDEQTQRTVNFMRDAVQAMQPTRPTEVTDRMLGMWKDSFENVRESMDTYARANMDLARTWTEFFQTAGNSATRAVAATVAAPAQAAQSAAQTVHAAQNNQGNQGQGGKAQRSGN